MRIIPLVPVMLLSAGIAMMSVCSCKSPGVAKDRITQPTSAIAMPAGSASATEEKKVRAGVPIMSSRELQANVLIVAPSTPSSLELVQKIHSSSTPSARGDLTVDDSTAESPVYFFDLRFPGIKVDGYALWLQVFSLGAENAMLPVTVRRSHFMLVVVDARDKAALKDTARWSRLRAEASKAALAHVHLLLTHSDGVAAATVDEVREGTGLAFVSVSKTTAAFDSDTGVAAMKEIVRDVVRANTPLQL